MKGIEQLYEAVVESYGRIRLNNPVHLAKGLRVFVTIPQAGLDTALSGIALSEPVLSVDWNKPEEDEAWAHLQ